MDNFGPSLRKENSEQFLLFSFFDDVSNLVVGLKPLLTGFLAASCDLFKWNHVAIFSVQNEQIAIINFAELSLMQFHF